MDMKNIDFNTLNRDLDKLRKTIGELKDEAHWLQTAKIGKADLIEDFNSKVDREAAKSNLMRSVFADMSPFVERTRKLDEYSQSVDIGPLLCSLFGGEIKRRVADMIKDLDYEAGPPLAERPELLRQNTEQLLQLESAEEELICKAERQGWFIDRRPDVRPEIFLEWDDSVSEPAAEPDEPSEPEKSAIRLQSKPRGTSVLADWMELP